MSDQWGANQPPQPGNGQGPGQGWNKPAPGQGQGQGPGAGQPEGNPNPYGQQGGQQSGAPGPYSGGGGYGQQPQNPYNPQSGPLHGGGGSGGYGTPGGPGGPGGYGGGPGSYNGGYGGVPGAKKGMSGGMIALLVGGGLVGLLIFGIIGLAVIGTLADDSGERPIAAPSADPLDPIDEGDDPLVPEEEPVEEEPLDESGSEEVLGGVWDAPEKRYHVRNSPDIGTADPAAFEIVVPIGDGSNPLDVTYTIPDEDSAVISGSGCGVLDYQGCEGFEAARMEGVNVSSRALAVLVKMPDEASAEALAAANPLISGIEGEARVSIPIEKGYVVVVTLSGGSPQEQDQLRRGVGITAVDAVLAANFG